MLLISKILIQQQPEPKGWEVVNDELSITPSQVAWLDDGGQPVTHTKHSPILLLPATWTSSSGSDSVAKRRNTHRPELDFSERAKGAYRLQVEVSGGRWIYEIALKDHWEHLIEQ